MHESEKWKWSCSVMSNSSKPYGLQPTRLLHPWDFPGKSTGVRCHCLLLQVLNLVTLKLYFNISHSVVSNSSWPYGLQPTRLLHPWDFPGKNTEVGCHCLLCVVQECAFFLLFTAASSHLSLEDLSSPMWQKVDLNLTHSDSDWANFLQGVKLAGANKRAHSKYCRSRELSLKNTPYHPSNYVLHKRELT